MVVARKSRKQTAQRTFDFSGASVVKPESERLADWIDITVRTPTKWWSRAIRAKQCGRTEVRIVFVGRFVLRRSGREPEQGCSQRQKLRGEDGPLDCRYGQSSGFMVSC